eukprot:jgi/Astpho2/8704/fgenesh1_pg.00128_%23_14_t
MSVALLICLCRNLRFQQGATLFAVPDQQQSAPPRATAQGQPPARDTSQRTHQQLGECNVGFQLLQKAGWRSGQGLGASEQGQTEPLAAWHQQGRAGIGVGNAPQLNAAEKQAGSSGQGSAQQQQQQPATGMREKQLKRKQPVPNVPEAFDTKVRRHQQALHNELGNFREPSVPDLSDEAESQEFVGHALGAGERQAPPKDDGPGAHADSPRTTKAKGRPAALQIPGEGADQASAAAAHQGLEQRAADYRAILAGGALGTAAPTANRRRAGLASRSKAEKPAVGRLMPWEGQSLDPSETLALRLSNTAVLASTPASSALATVTAQGSMASGVPCAEYQPDGRRPGWNSSAKAASNDVALSLSDANRQESLQEMRQRFMSRLQQANDAMHSNLAKRQGHRGSMGKPSAGVHRAEGKSAQPVQLRRPRPEQLQQPAGHILPVKSSAALRQLSAVAGSQEQLRLQAISGLLAARQQQDPQTAALAGAGSGRYPVDSSFEEWPDLSVLGNMPSQAAAGRDPGSGSAAAGPSSSNAANASVSEGPREPSAQRRLTFSDEQVPGQPPASQWQMPSPRLGRSWPGLPGVLAAPPATKQTQQDRTQAPAGVDRRTQSAFAPRRASGEPLAESRVSLAALLGRAPEASALKTAGCVIQRCWHSRASKDLLLVKAAGVLLGVGCILARRSPKVLRERAMPSIPEQQQSSAPSDGAGTKEAAGAVAASSSAGLAAVADRQPSFRASERTGLGPAELGSSAEDAEDGQNLELDSRGASMSSRSSSLARFASPTRSSAARARTQAPSPAAGAGMPARGSALQPGDEQAASSEGGASELGPGSRRGPVERGEGSAAGSRRGAAEPGVGGVQAHTPDVEVSPSRLGTGSRRRTAERGRGQALARQDSRSPRSSRDGARSVSSVRQGGADPVLEGRPAWGSSGTVAPTQSPQRAAGTGFTPREQRRSREVSLRMLDPSRVSRSAEPALRRSTSSTTWSPKQAEASAGAIPPRVLTRDMSRGPTAGGAASSSPLSRWASAAPAQLKLDSSASSRPLRRYGSTAAGPGAGASGRSPLKRYGSTLRSQEGGRSPLSRQASHAGRQSSPSSRRGTTDSLSGSPASPSGEGGFSPRSLRRSGSASFRSPPSIPVRSRADRSQGYSQLGARGRQQSIAASLLEDQPLSVLAEEQRAGGDEVPGAQQPMPSGSTAAASADEGLPERGAASSSAAQPGAAAQAAGRAEPAAQADAGHGNGHVPLPGAQSSAAEARGAESPQQRPPDPLNPAFRMVSDAVWAPAADSPNMRKYGRSSSSEALIPISKHPLAQALIREAPAAGSMTGRQLLEALARGTEMHKAWEGGSGGSRRLVQVTMADGKPQLTYSHGWMRKRMQYTIQRTHVPGGPWQSGKSITLDTDNGAIDLEPGSLQDYAVWVLGLNAALVGEHGRQVAQTVDLPASQMSWCRSMFTMSA